MNELAAARSLAERTERGDLRVAPVLASFVEEEALPGTGVEPDAFWAGLSALVHEFGPRNAALLRRRAELQAEIDAWHVERRNQPHDREAYKAFLAEIGYLLPEGERLHHRDRERRPRDRRACPGRSSWCRSPTPASR